MKIISTLFVALCLSASTMAGTPADDIIDVIPADTVITTAPDGTLRHFYGTSDVINIDVQMFMPQVFAPVDLIFGNDGYVYMKTPVLTDYSSAYLKGKLTADGKSVEFDNHQAIYTTPNTGMTIYACITKDGYAGTIANNKFFDTKIVMDIEGDQLINSNTLIGAFSDSVQNCYDYATLPVLRDNETVDKATKVYSLKYNYLDGTSKIQGSSNASIYTDDKAVFIKGFLPKYSDAWVAATKVEGEDSLSILSSYILQRSPYTGITFLFGNNASGLLASTKLGYNKATGEISSLDGEYFAGYYLDTDYNLACGTQYTNLAFAPLIVADIATPANPQNLKYQEGSYKMMRFNIRTTDKEGNAINTNNLYYRIYVNGQPYTFRKDVYTHLTEDMTLIPYSFTNNGYPFDRSSNPIYVEFSQIDTPQTVGVQEVYIADGQEQCSDILTYNVETREQSIVTTIGDIRSVPAAAEYYDLNGRRLQQPVKGIGIVRQADGTMKKVMF